MLGRQESFGEGILATICCCSCCLTCTIGKSGPENSPAAAHTINADIIMMAQKGTAVQREESSLKGGRKTAGMHKQGFFQACGPRGLHKRHRQQEER